MQHFIILVLNVYTVLTENNDKGINEELSLSHNKGSDDFKMTWYMQLFSWQGYAGHALVNTSHGDVLMSGNHDVVHEYVIVFGFQFVPYMVNEAKVDSS